MAGYVYRWLMVSICSLLFLILTGFSPIKQKYNDWHPIYVCVIELEYNAIDKTLEISCKMFSDDFEKALAKANNGFIDILKPKDTALLEKQIADYIRKHFQLKTEGKNLPLEYVGYEIAAESTMSYFQVSGVNQAPKKLDISVDILHELYTSQINILHLKIGDSRKSTKLDYPTKGVSVEF